MSLEDEINQVLVAADDDVNPIEEWEWNDEYIYRLHWSATFPPPYEHYYSRVHEIIEGATLVACLTSPSTYVRKYREWYESRR